MVPMPRYTHLRLPCPVPNCRYFKATSPTRTWLMSPKSSGALPAGYPLSFYQRRGSTNPISSLALSNSVPQRVPPPNRSRSLDGLLDSDQQQQPKVAEEVSNNPSEAVDENCNNDNLSKTKAHSVDDFLDSSADNSCDLDKSSLNSNNSDAKRKKNFMDRCVNKMRSFIKK